MRVLIVEDDPKLAGFLGRALTEVGHTWELVAEGPDGLEALRTQAFDLAVLDWMLPGCDGIELLRQARAEGLATPVLMLTAREAVDDRVLALDAGADDYLIKPFALEELFARLRALERRRAEYANPIVQVGDLVLDPATRTARRRGKVIELTAREYELLELLMRHADRVVTRAVIEERVWGYDFDPSSNVVQVYISYLRQKIDLPGEPSVIQTVRGVGYRLHRPMEA